MRPNPPVIAYSRKALRRPKTAGFPHSSVPRSRLLARIRLLLSPSFSTEQTGFRHECRQQCAAPGQPRIACDRLGPLERKPETRRRRVHPPRVGLRPVRSVEGRVDLGAAQPCSITLKTAVLGRKLVRNRARDRPARISWARLHRAIRSQPVTNTSSCGAPRAVPPGVRDHRTQRPGKQTRPRELLGERQRDDRPRVGLVQIDHIDATVPVA